MSAHTPTLSYQQIIRLLTAIVGLPAGPRRNRYFKFLIRSDAPATIARIDGLADKLVEGSHA